MKPHATAGAGRRGVPPWVMVVFFVCAALNLLAAKWLSAAFFVVSALVLLKHRAIERAPKLVRYLVVAAMAALAVAMFVKLILDLKSRG